MSAVAIDFASEGLLDGAGDERAREARLELLRTLEAEGFELDELRRATQEGRLALLPVERVLDGEGPRYTQEELVEEIQVLVIAALVILCAEAVIGERRRRRKAVAA